MFEHSRSRQRRSCQVNSKTNYTLSRVRPLRAPCWSDKLNVSATLQWRRGCSVVYCPGWGLSPAAGNTATPGPAGTRAEGRRKSKAGCFKCSSISCQGWRRWCLAHLCHNLQGPAVPHADGLCGVGGDLAVLLRRPEQSGPENCRQIVERHLVDTFLLRHPGRG